MRKCLPVVLLLPLTSAAVALAANEPRVDSSTLRALAEKAEHASLRDQCFLYAQLVRNGTELADSELAEGDSEASALALRSVEAYTGMLDTALAGDAKKLKDAEILLRESAFRLKAAMLASSLEDRPALASALVKINASEAKVLGAVFAH
ncbi:hypothetical protein [Acidipila sp. EB88]|uniref:hypothetical protein n=1 Tax=Acidipila sp. EB88 TaxID=2305226 RepID=UPI000F5F99D2|nr:hypothetical protein [Acidipila sp. EB88]RRA47183.1 hypothetical protein D1Y84_01655 [Acidipila sp. EB88]